MKAAVFYEAERMQVEEVAQPEVGDDEVLVKVRACGFCGSDVEYYYGRSPVMTPTGKGPIILGHELAGEVVALGKVPESLGVLKVGDKVAVNPVQYCNACDNCNRGKPMFCRNLRVKGVTENGGFAEFVVSKYAHCYKLPETVAFEQGAFVEPLAAAVNAVEQTEIFPGAFCVVMGPGPVGLAMVQLCRLHGAGTICVVGTRDYRLEIAKKLGADIVMNVSDKQSAYYVDNLVEAIKEATNGQLADRVVVPTSNLKANQDALAISGNGSVVVFFGLAGPDDKVEVPLLSSLYQAKTIKFSLLYPYQWVKTVDFLAKGLVKTDDILTHREPLERIAPAIERVVNREDKVLKTVITP